MVGDKYWWKNAVIYQIYPASFKDSKEDGFGDLRGIIEKLDYLNGTSASLGIDAIWLSPFYKSPMADWGYDVSDYYSVDPRFGIMDDFKELVKMAHKKGIRVIADYVPNHTSNEHPWFLESKISKDTKKRDWYVWEGPKADGSPPNNWLSVFGGSAWTFDYETAQYYLHSFLPEQPDLNWRNPEVINEMKKVLLFWLNKGVDGFRVDALSHLLKDEKLRDEPKNPDYQEGKDNPYDSLVHVRTKNHKDLPRAIKQMSSVLVPGRNFMIGEMSDLSPKQLLKYQKVCRRELHIPFNFNLLELDWDAGEYKKLIDEYLKVMRGKYTPNWVLGNHDRPRVVSRIGRKEAKVAAMLSMCLGGISLVYYGEEIGMENTKIVKSEVKDTWEKIVPGLGLGRDPERTPMQWNKTKNAGFTKATPWLPVNKNYINVNVKSEKKKSDSMLRLYQELIVLKKENKALREGKYVSLKTSNQNVLAFARIAGEDEVYVVLNFSGKKVKVTVGDKDTKIEPVLSTYLDNKDINKNLKDISLRGNEGVVFKDNK